MYMVDLEMPGPSIFRGKQLVTAVEARKVSKRTINNSVRRLLELINRAQPPALPDKKFGVDNEDEPNHYTQSGS